MISPPPEQTFEMATASGQSCEAGRVILSMTLNDVGRKLLVERPDRLPALLETIVVTPGAPACRSSSPVLLRIDPLRTR